MKVVFIWGQGGVGKSHFCLREAYRESEFASTQLITLDPSLRLYDLINLEPSKTEASILSRRFSIQRLRAQDLFDQLADKLPASSQVREFYSKMVEGLVAFRDYLALIQLTDLIQKASHNTTLIVDTPPFQDAKGLHLSMLRLKRFFESGLVQIALKTSRFSMVQMTLRKVFEVSKYFVGSKTTEAVLGLLEWMAHHQDRFQRSAQTLETLLVAPTTEHLFVMTPETSSTFLNSVLEIFPPKSRKRFVMNRSVLSFESSSSNDPFVREILHLKSLELQLRDQLERAQISINGLEMRAMGEDSAEELADFVTAEATL